MPTLLDAALVADSLRALPGWSGSPDRIMRTVAVDGEQAARLRALVAEAADAMDHHPVLEDERGALRFVLWTHSSGGVTELDIALASRISDLVHQVTGQQGVDAHRHDGADIVAESGRSAASPLDPTVRGERRGVAEPATVGVSSGTGDTPHVPLPDDAPFAPEPGVTGEQEPGALDR